MNSAAKDLQNYAKEKLGSDVPKPVADLISLCAILEKASGIVEDARLQTQGLIGYEGLRDRLAIDGKRPCLRTVKALASKHKRILRPVELGHRLVGFRPARVEALLAHLAGDEQMGGAQL